MPGAGSNWIGHLLSRRGRTAGPTAQGPGLGAVLFDMDGLLIDSEPFWTVAEQDLARSVGAAWTPELKAECIGKRIDVTVPIMLAGLGQPVTLDSVAAASGMLMKRMTELFAERLPVMPGVRELLDDLAGNGVPCALVSSSHRVLVDACLRALVGHPFSVSIAGDEVERAKPDPQPYLLAAAGLGVDPARCVVLEDSAAGAQAGVAAGSATVLIPSATVPPPTNGGWTELTSLTGVTLASLQALVNRQAR